MPMKNVVKLTDMTVAVYRGRKTITQHQQQQAKYMVPTRIH